MAYTTIETDNVTYIGAFLTFACQFKCPYCVNRYGEFKPRKAMNWQDWVDGLARIRTRDDLPITLQGGEPTLLPWFEEMIRTLWILGKKMDILTNFQVDYNKWKEEIPSGCFLRPSKYPSIRVSYHPGQSSFLGLASRVYRASRSGYSIGIWAVDHPSHYHEVRILRKICRMIGIDFRFKEFLGWYEGVFYGEYAYPKAVGQITTKRVTCKSNEILIAPDGYIHRCHADLYAGRDAIGHILDPISPKIGEWRACSHYGQCNSCDIKNKTNRFQETGYCSVEIRPLTT
jgi:hypothetical protein